MKCMCLFVAIGLIVGAVDGKSDDAKKESDKLKGTWQATAAEEKGRPKNREAKGIKFIFDGDAFTLHIESFVAKGTFVVAADKKPKTIDLVIKEAPDESKGKTIRGIYELNGDELRFCANRPDGDRPKEFVTKDTDFILITLKRETK